MSKALFELIRKEMPGLFLLENEPMSEHCSFRIGGPADIFAEPADADELCALLSLFRRHGQDYVVVGKGTNLLISGEGIRRPVIHIGPRMGSVVRQGDAIEAEAGLSLARLAVFAQQNGLTGLEFAHGIPGSLGGACFMNAGAYGGEMKDIVSAVRCVDAEGRILCHEGSENCFAYRRSRYMDSGEIVISARLELSPGDGEAIGAKMRELMERRSASQPLDKPSAGSTFKRPENGYAAAMIDQAGLKGFTLGGAQVSEKHAGFVVNLGGASFEDVAALMEHVQQTVYERSGTLLEPEVRIIRG